MLIALLALLAGILDRTTMAVVIFAATASFKFLWMSILYAQLGGGGVWIGLSRVSTILAEHMVIVFTPFLVGLLVRGVALSLTRLVRTACT